MLARHGLARHQYAPPLFMLLWKLGLRARPPQFMSFVLTMLSFGAWFAVIWGAVMWFAFWSRDGKSLPVAAAMAAGAGLCYGLAMAFYYRRQRRKHGLPAWESLCA
ncbi:DUF6404 family protein [Massilia sp. ST3]|uniref:DUF6404 family protein n=1 Tax=Massilia sp. ST3 TaxID=2824903 RepID=UPI001B83B9C2|nr:DUF6404 family protein [Massilia sp. ST3]MBQ5946522.1 hypothetical protein [Massilia sp. ST3]